MPKPKHDFQPIINKERYTQALVYIAQQANKLALQVLGESLPADTLTIFSQSSVEYKYIANHLKTNKTVSPITHGATLYVETYDLIDNNRIILLGVRQPDENRPEVGYADFSVDNYQQLKNLHAKNKNVHEITSGIGVPLLEIKHPDFDVRGYIIQKGQR